MKDNKHTEPIPEQVITQVHTQLTAILSQLRDYVTPLTPQERHSLLKMGDKSLAFVEKAHDYAVDNPSLVPSFLDMADFEKDWQDAHGLWNVLNLGKQLVELLDDTVMSAGSEAYHAALAVYHNTQAAAKQDVPGAKAVYEDLKTRFPGGKRRGGSDETDVGTETE